MDMPGVQFAAEGNNSGVCTTVMSIVAKAIHSAIA